MKCFRAAWVNACAAAVLASHGYDIVNEADLSNGLSQPASTMGKEREVGPIWPRRTD